MLEKLMENKRLLKVLSLAKSLSPKKEFIEAEIENETNGKELIFGKSSEELSLEYYICLSDYLKEFENVLKFLKG